MSWFRRKNPEADKPLSPLAERLCELSKLEALWTNRGDGDFWIVNTSDPLIVTLQPENGKVLVSLLGSSEWLGGADAKAVLGAFTALASKIPPPIHPTATDKILARLSKIPC
jgi:hypothetical protein